MPDGGVGGQLKQKNWHIYLSPSIMYNLTHQAAAFETRWSNNSSSNSSNDTRDSRSSRGNNSCAAAFDPSKRWQQHSSGTAAATAAVFWYFFGTEHSYLCCAFKCISAPGRHIYGNPYYGFYLKGRCTSHGDATPYGSTVIGDAQGEHQKIPTRHGVRRGTSSPAHTYYMMLPSPRHAPATVPWLRALEKLVLCLE